MVVLISEIHVMSATFCTRNEYALHRLIYKSEAPPLIVSVMQWSVLFLSLISAQAAAKPPNILFILAGQL